MTHASQPMVVSNVDAIAVGNCLLALGARASMATHPALVTAMCRGAGAILINLNALEMRALITKLTA